MLDSIKKLKVQTRLKLDLAFFQIFETRKILELLKLNSIKLKLVKNLVNNHT